MLWIFCGSILRLSPPKILFILFVFDNVYTKWVLFWSFVFHSSILPPSLFRFSKCGRVLPWFTTCFVLILIFILCNSSLTFLYL
uniref:Ovule protein n=1 Tax=Meloidogyne incognita TaxID=6306 RepID=A0A914KHU9_MELIC